jgi:hypothetical protein
LLKLGCASDCVNNTGELDEQAVAVVLTMRPWYLAILRSMHSLRKFLRRSSVPSSSAPISREYPTTSAARIAARRRLWFMRVA